MAQPTENIPETGVGRRLPVGRRGLVILAVAVPVFAFLGILTWALLTTGPARGGLAVNNDVVELDVDSEPAPEFTVALYGGGRTQQRRRCAGRW